MNYAVLCDLNSINISFDTFFKAISQLDGKITYYKFYSYNNKRNNDWTAFIRNNSADIAVPVANRKKVRLDIRQAMDSIMIACNNKAVDGFFIICSPIEASTMITALRALGKKVVIGTCNVDSLALSCDSYILLDRMAGCENMQSMENNNLTIEKHLDTILNQVKNCPNNQLENIELTANNSNHIANLQNTALNNQYDINSYDNSNIDSNINVDSYGNSISNSSNNSNTNTLQTYSYDNLSSQENVNSKISSEQVINCDNTLFNAKQAMLNGNSILNTEQILSNDNSITNNNLQIHENSTFPNKQTMYNDNTSLPTEQTISNENTTLPNKQELLFENNSNFQTMTNTNLAFADKFLPYTEVEGDEKEMKELKDDLIAMINQKAQEKSRINKEQKAIDIDNLLKKYF